MDLVKYNTDRGFRRISFKDYYGNYCSFQESSLADVEAIWFGIDEALPKQLVKGEGWEDYTDIPDNVHINTRMHLTRDQAKVLGEILIGFAETGELKIRRDK